MKHIIQKRLMAKYLIFWLVALSPLAHGENHYYSEQNFRTPDFRIQILPNKVLYEDPFHYAEKRGDIIQIRRNSRPSMEIFHAETAPSAKGTVLILPGGAYHSLVYDAEGAEIAYWLNSIGFTAVILRYVVPTHSGTAPLRDAQRAISLLKQNADIWKINVNKIGTMGFSAGGHVAVRLAVEGNNRVYDLIDEADSQSLEHHFSALIYPAYLASETELKLNSNIVVSDKIPPTFIFHPKDDAEYIHNSLAYSEDLTEAHHRAEIHLPEQGGHGFGLRSEPGTDAADWPNLFEIWVNSL